MIRIQVLQSIGGTAPRNQIETPLEDDTRGIPIEGKTPTPCLQAANRERAGDRARRTLAASPLTCPHSPGTR